MAREIEKIIRLFKRTYEKGAWHGPSVKDVLQDITQDVSLMRFPNTHSILELVAHMTAWRRFVSRKLQGDHEYKVSDDMNFPVVTDWLKAVSELEASHVELLEAVKAFDEAKLGDLVPNSSHPYTYYTLIHGIIHHDLYHAGQIMLIKRSFAGHTS